MAKSKPKKKNLKWFLILGLLLIVGGFIYLFREALFWKTYRTDWTYPANHTGFKVSYPAAWSAVERKEYIGNIYPGWELVEDQYLLDICIDIDFCSSQDAIGDENPVAIFVLFSPEKDINNRINRLKEIISGSRLYEGEKVITRKLSDTVYRLTIENAFNGHGTEEMKFIKDDDGWYIVKGLLYARSETFQRYYQGLVKETIDNFELLK